MSRQSILAGEAVSARTIDFAHNTASGKSSSLWHSYEFVSQYTLKSHVAFGELQVRLTNAGLQNLNAHLTLRDNWLIGVGSIDNFILAQFNGTHSRLRC